MIRLKDNMYILLKIQNKQIGDLEKFVGRSTGYFARTKNIQSIQIQTLIKMSEFFNVSIDKLLFDDMENDLIDIEIKKLEGKLEELKRKKGMEK